MTAEPRTAQHRQLAADAAFHRAEHERLVRELAAMTSGHAAAIGPTALQRMNVDVDVHLQLAEELEAYLGAPASALDAGPGLF